ERVRHGQVLGIAAVPVPPGVRRGRAEVLRATATVPAGAVGAGQPGGADPVARQEPGSPRAGSGDLPDHLVPGGDAGRPGRSVTRSSAVSMPARQTERQTILLGSTRPR